MTTHSNNINRNDSVFTKLLIGSVFLAFVGAKSIACAAETDSTKPNIVLLFIDDWAWNSSPVTKANNTTAEKVRYKKAPAVWLGMGESVRYSTGSNNCASKTAPAWSWCPTTAIATRSFPDASNRITPRNGGRGRAASASP